MWKKLGKSIRVGRRSGLKFLKNVRRNSNGTEIFEDYLESAEDLEDTVNLGSVSQESLKYTGKINYSGVSLESGSTDTYEFPVSPLQSLENSSKHIGGKSLGRKSYTSNRKYLSKKKKPATKQGRSSGSSYPVNHLRKSQEKVNEESEPESAEEIYQINQVSSQSNCGPSGSFEHPVLENAGAPEMPTNFSRNLEAHSSYRKYVSLTREAQTSSQSCNSIPVKGPGTSHLNYSKSTSSSREGRRSGLKFLKNVKRNLEGTGNFEDCFECAEDSEDTVNLGSVSQESLKYIGKINYSGVSLESGSTDTYEFPVSPLQSLGNSSKHVGRKSLGRKSYIFNGKSLFKKKKPATKQQGRSSKSSYPVNHLRKSQETVNEESEPESAEDIYQFNQVSSQSNCSPSVSFEHRVLENAGAPEMPTNISRNFEAHSSYRKSVSPTREAQTSSQSCNSIPVKGPGTSHFNYSESTSSKNLVENAPELFDESPSCFATRERSLPQELGHDEGRDSEEETDIWPKRKYRRIRPYTSRDKPSNPLPKTKQRAEKKSESKSTKKAPSPTPYVQGRPQRSRIRPLKYWKGEYRTFRYLISGDIVLTEIKLVDSP